MKKGAYTGLVCYVGHTQEAAPGHIVEGGWLYSVEVDEETKVLAVAHAQAAVNLAEDRFKKLPGSLGKRALDQAKEHLATVESMSFEYPAEKLTITSDPDSEPKYRYATASDVSHHEQHHQSLRVLAVNGYMGEPQTQEEIDACHRHLDDLSERIGNLDPHEKDHLITSATDVLLARKGLPPRSES